MGGRPCHREVHRTIRGKRGEADRCGERCKRIRGRFRDDCRATSARNEMTEENNVAAAVHFGGKVGRTG
jgi:hypothetical protein